VEFDTRPIGVTVGSVDFRARWYPSEMAGNFFLTGAVGMGFIRFSDSEARPTSETLTGRAVRGGLGYDFRVAHGVSFTPFATGAGIHTTSDGDSMRMKVWQVGMELTVH
jgi:hypothetical protein